MLVEIKNENSLVLSGVYWNGQNDITMEFPVNSVVLDYTSKWNEDHQDYYPGKVVYFKSAANGDVYCAANVDEIRIAGKPEPGDAIDTIVWLSEILGTFNKVIESGGGGTSDPQYFKVTNLENRDGEIGFYREDKWGYSSSMSHIEYSYDGETWNDWDFTLENERSVRITFPANGYVMFRNGDLNIPNNYSYIKLFVPQSAPYVKGPSYKVSGKLTYLTNGNMHQTKYQYLFYNRIIDEGLLVDASELIMPESIIERSFYNMFNNCSALTTAPKLPATTLANDCYAYMFNNCSALTTAPELPATTLTRACYESMFKGCSSLVNAPELPATTLARTCYASMFFECTNLTTAPVLPATTLINECYTNMFQGCSSLTEIPKLQPYTYSGNPARALEYMFKGCTSLTRIDTNAFQNMIENGDIIYGMFGDDKNLKTLTLDLSNSQDSLLLYHLFYGDESQITSITFRGALNYNFALIDCKNIDYNSVKSALTAAAATNNTNAKTLFFNLTVTDVDSELTNLVAECTSKGWTISGLTIN